MSIEIKNLLFDYFHLHLCLLFFIRNPLLSLDLQAPASQTLCTSGKFPDRNEATMWVKLVRHCGVIVVSLWVRIVGAF